MIKKATSEDVQGLFRIAFDNAHIASDPYMKRDLVRYAEKQGLQQHLPEEAHGMMHDMGVQHNHPDMKNDPESGLHTHVVVKAFNPKAFEGTIVKSWGDGDVVHFEGWLSTPTKDQEKDITEPEAFIPGMDSYFKKSAPLSIEHNGKSLPIGHLQKAMVLRKGVIVKSSVHPTDPADFEHFNQSGTQMDGVWVRGVVNEEPGISALRKGNVGGMSFIGNARNPEMLPGGRYRITTIDPWIESTIAAYPINPEAVIQIAKAYGLSPDEEKEPPTMTLEEILAQAAAQVQAEKQTQAQAEADAPLTKADLGKYLLEMQTKHDAEVAELKKAFEAAPIDRGVGVGRKGVVPSAEDKGVPTLESDPLAYILRKAATLDGDNPDALDLTERALVEELLNRAMLEGLRP